MSSNNCSVFETVRYDVALGLRSGLSFISCFLTFYTVFIIILFKKYMFFTQRLILYLALSCSLYLLSAGFNLTGKEAYESTSALNYCIVIGFAEQLTIWWTIMATFCIVMALFIHAVCRKQTNRFELGYLFIIFIFPILFCWVPFYFKAYGPDDMFCWIRELNLNDTCTEFKTGQLLRYSLYYIPLTILMLLLVALYIPVLVIVHKKKNQWTGQFNPEAMAIKNMIATEIRPLIYYPLIILVINAFPLVKQLYATAVGKRGNINIYFYISLVSYIIYPFQGALVTLAFTLDPETRKQMTWKNILVALMKCRRSKYGAIKDYPIETISSDSWSAVTHYGSIEKREESSSQ